MRRWPILFVVGALLAAGAMASAAPGDSVRLVVRPEAIEVADAAPGRPQATVLARTFLGEKIEYVLQCADATLQAVRYSGAPAEHIVDGAAVGIRFAEGAVTVLPERSA